MVGLALTIQIKSVSLGASCLQFQTTNAGKSEHNAKPARLRLLIYY
jgi:hypothetical protein